MRLPGRAAIGRAVRWVRGQVDPAAAVLLYHRVADLPADPQSLAVTPAHFAEHLDVLRREARPTALAALATAARGEGVPGRAIAVTFDDGYVDNLTEAKPLLVRYDVPATVFVATGLLGRASEFWWDELERLLLRPGVLPPELTLTIEGTSHRWGLGEGSVYDQAAYERFCGWNVLAREDPTPRHKLYRDLAGRLRQLEPRERDTALAQLREWAGAEPSGRPTHRVMTPEEIRLLGEDGSVEVGAHTVTHPVLSALPPDAQHTEIADSKTRLEEYFGRPVTSFAYPFGSRADYSPTTVELVRGTGFRCACANYPAVIRREVDVYQIPRFLVRDWDGEGFAKRLRGWFGA